MLTDLAIIFYLLNILKLFWVWQIVFIEFPYLPVHLFTFTTQTPHHLTNPDTIPVLGNLYHRTTKDIFIFSSIRPLENWNHLRINLFIYLLVLHFRKALVLVYWCFPNLLLSLPHMASATDWCQFNSSLPTSAKYIDSLTSVISSVCSDDCLMMILYFVWRLYILYCLILYLKSLHKSGKDWSIASQVEIIFYSRNPMQVFTEPE